MIKIKDILINLRSSFWFVPCLFLIGSIILALGLIEIDGRYDHSWISDWPRLFGAGASASRGMLTSIASSTMSMMTVAFSMTLVTLALASSQYSSRILRSFMRSRKTQVVLGIFAGIFTYCLIVLRTVRGGDDSEYIPSISVFVGFILAVVGVGALVLFIHHIASSIQASNIVGSVAEDTLATIKKIFPEMMGDGKDEENVEDVPEFRKSVLAKKSGYIQSINEQELIKIACQWDIVIKMNYGIGEFVVAGMPIVSISSESDMNEKEANKIREIFNIQRNRTIEQDALFGIRQIVDVALKALSPGVNDTTTGVMCINYLTVICAQLTMRKIPSTYRFDNKKLRVVARAPDYEQFLRESFDQIRYNAKDNVTIIKELLNAIDILSQLTTSHYRRHYLLREAEHIDEVLQESLTFDYDKDRLDKQSEKLRASILYPSHASRQAGVTDLTYS